MGKFKGNDNYLKQHNGDNLVSAVISRNKEASNGGLVTRKNTDMFTYDTNNSNTKPLLITDTILRDAHQSQAATRMTLDDMLPALDDLNKIGYWSVECWGGATFDSCMRFLNEDPWQRLKVIREHMPNTKLQMLLRGQNLLGYKHYADDVVDTFVKKSIDNGIDVIRIFDALNDVRNLKKAVDSCKAYGGWCEMAFSYTSSPVHNEDYFVALAKTMEDMGADSICIKDMANLLLPYDAYSLVKRLKENVKVPIHLHTHNTTGTGDMVLLMATMAGVDIVDTALSPLANGTSNPSTEALVATLKGNPRDTGLDLQQLSGVAAHFRKVADRLKAAGILDPKVLNVDTKTLLYQVPGGMLSNLISQLKQAKAEDKLYDVLNEVPAVRKDFGYPPLVTPTSQIVGTQAVMNILAGERYKMVPKESKGLLRGEYGNLPGKVNEEVRHKAIGEASVITCRPADLLAPEMEKYKHELAEKGLGNGSEEDALSYALFPQVAEKFLAQRDKPSQISEATTNSGISNLSATTNPGALNSGVTSNPGASNSGVTSNPGASNSGVTSNPGALNSGNASASAEVRTLIVEDLTV